VDIRYAQLKSFTCDDRYKFRKWRRNPGTNEISGTFQKSRFVVFGDLKCNDIVFDKHVENEKTINVLYDDVSKHYHVLGNLTGALTRRYDCRGCNKGCKRGVMNKCQETCIDCMSVPPCPYADVRFPCEACNRHFRSRVCFEKQDKQVVKKVRMRTEAKLCHM
jgi:hypothetical protein